MSNADPRRNADSGPDGPSPGDASQTDMAGGESLERQLQEANDRVLRAQAELENFRRRMRREAEDERKYAAQPLLVDLLPVLDNIQRAVQAAEKSADAGGLVDGVKMVAHQLSSVLEKHHCRRIAALGKAFDPQVHEALTQQPSTEYPPHTVTHVHQDGYQLHDRVIRPAQVVVSSAP